MRCMGEMGYVKFHLLPPPPPINLSMDERAERGAAAHGLYKGGISDPKVFFFRPPTHFSHMSPPTFPISHTAIWFF